MLWRLYVRLTATGESGRNACCCWHLEAADEAALERKVRERCGPDTASMITGLSVVGEALNQPRMTRMNADKKPVAAEFPSVESASSAVQVSPANHHVRGKIIRERQRVQRD